MAIRRAQHSSHVISGNMFLTEKFHCGRCKVGIDVFEVLTGLGPMNIYIVI